MKIKSIHNLKGRTGRIASLIILLSAIFIAPFVKAAQWGDWTYTSDGSNVTITGYGGTDGDVVIPDEIFNMAVVAVGNFAFENNTNLTTAIIPDSVERIGWYAFFECNHLTSVTIGNKVKDIMLGAFANSGLTSVLIPAAVSNIGVFAFGGCSNLNEINVEASNSVYSCDDGVLFDKSLTTLLQCPGGKADSYTISSSVSNIGHYAFSGCTHLTNISISSSVANVPYMAFVGCANLSNIVIPNSVTNIDGNAFQLCTSLRSMIIPAGIISIQYEAFFYCTNLTKVYFKGDAPKVSTPIFDGDNNLTVYYYPSTTGWTNTYGGRPTVPLDILYSVDNGAVTITGYTGTNSFLPIPNTISNMPVVAIEDFAFSNLTSLTSVIIPDCVSNIGTGAFFHCYNLTSAVLPSELTSIKYWTFQNCLNLQSITVSEGVTNIGVMAFMGCVSLTNAIIPDSCLEIQDWAFFWCDSLTDIFIPGSVSSIGTAVFADNDHLLTIVVSPSNQFYSSTNDMLFNKSQTTLIQCPSGKIIDIVIPDSVVNIGDYAFASCPNLTSLIIPNRVTNLGRYVFYNDAGLENIVIPYGVGYIGDGAFAWCSNLTNILFKSNPPVNGSLIFDWDDSLTVYYYPWTSGWTATYGGRPTQVNPAYTQWLLDYSFATNRTEDSTDYDKDGMLNWQEFIAHTDPTTNIDLLAIISVGSESNQSQISWSAKSNVAYQVMKSSDLMVAWSNAPSGIGGNQQSFQTAPVDGLLQYADPNVAEMTNAFYRVNVVP
jgi:hypothetical protein